MDVVTQAILQGQINTNETAIATNTQDISELSDLVTVAAVDNVYALDVKNQLNITKRIVSADANAKAITLSNVPSTSGKVAQVRVLFVATTACAITHPTGATFADGAPTFTTGQSYWLLYVTVDGGTTYQAFSKRAV